MKKSLLVILLCWLGMTAFAQLDVVSNSPSTDSVIVKELGGKSVIHIMGDGVYLSAKDWYSSTYVRLFLGKDLNAAKISLQQIESWFKKAQKGDYMTVKNPDGRQVTIYVKTPAEMTLYLSYGDIAYMRAISKVMISSDERNKLKGDPISNVMYSVILRGLDKLSK